MPGDEQMKISHIAKLASLEASTKSAHHRIDNLVDELIPEIREMNKNMAEMNKNVAVLAQSSVRHEKDITDIKKSMETKETVGRLHGKVEELEAMFEEKQHEELQNKLNSYEDMKKFILKVVVGLGFGIIASLVIFAVIVLTAMANAGALPTP